MPVPTITTAAVTSGGRVVALLRERGGGVVDHREAARPDSDGRAAASPRSRAARRRPARLDRDRRGREWRGRRRRRRPVPHRGSRAIAASSAWPSKRSPVGTRSTTRPAGPSATISSFVPPRSKPMGTRLSPGSARAPRARRARSSPRPAPSGGTSLSTSMSITARPLPGFRPTVMRAMLMLRWPRSLPEVADHARRVVVLHEQQVPLRDRVHLDPVHVDEAQVVAAEERARHREVALGGLEADGHQVGEGDLGRRGGLQRRRSPARGPARARSRG